MAGQHKEGTALESLLARMTQAKDECWHNWQSGKTQAWFDGKNFDMAYEDDQLRVFICDLYTACNPSFLQQQDIDIVVNLMGEAAARDEYNGICGPRHHWEYDKNRYNREFVNEMCPNQRHLVESEYLPEGKGGENYYSVLAEQFGRPIEYIEEAAADNDYFNFKEVFPAIIARVEVALARLRHVGEGKKAAGIVFHCYGGRNRSATSLLAFLFTHLRGRSLQENDGDESVNFCGADGSEVAMTKLILALVEKRPCVLTRMRANHRHFVQTLLEFAGEQ